MSFLDGTLTRSQEQSTWQYKALVALKDDALGRDILLALVAYPWKPKHDGRRRIVTTCTVDKDGLAWCGVARCLNGPQKIVCLGQITDIRDEFRRLADHLKLDDAERLELFNELRMWVAVDMRADHEEMARSTWH